MQQELNITEVAKDKIAIMHQEIKGSLNGLSLTLLGGAELMSDFYDVEI